ncbi:hypothetical protein [Mycobacterium syngnathidarum]
MHEIFRLDDRLTARFCLEPDDIDLVWSELWAKSEAAGELAGRTRFNTPVPVAIGVPGRAYPMPWFVQSLLDGTVAPNDDPGESEGSATVLAVFISGVRRVDTRGRRYIGGGRGGRLADHEWIQICLARREGLLDVAVFGRIW